MEQDTIRRKIVSISKERLASLPAEEYAGEIQLIVKEEDLPGAIEALRESDVIGFDTETRPSFKKGLSHTVSLLQLSTREKCFLIRLNHTGLTQNIIDLLQDGGKLKVGLSIHDDFHNLNKLAPVEPKGFIDLQQFVKSYSIADNSLSRIYGILFGKRLSKNQRLTNWEAAELTPAQQGYASLDALACISIYDCLTQGNFDPALSEYYQDEPLPPPPVAEVKPQEPKAEDTITNDRAPKKGADSKKTRTKRETKPKTRAKAKTTAKSKATAKSKTDKAAATKGKTAKTKTAKPKTANRTAKKAPGAQASIQNGNEN